MRGCLAEEGRLQEELRKHIARGTNVECVSCFELFVRDCPPQCSPKSCKTKWVSGRQIELEVFLVDSSFALPLDV